MRSAGTSIQNSFVQGLVTEATGINFPENACTATYDCIHNFNGSVETRAGFDFEPNYGTKTIDRTERVVVTYLWKDVAGDGDVTFLVVQVGGHIYFYNASTTQPISNFPLSTTIDLTAYVPAGGPSPELTECQFAVGNGLLFITHPNTEALSVSYDPNLATFTTTSIGLVIRDFQGQSDGYVVDFRPDTPLSGLSPEHKYNLYNQGWIDANINSFYTTTNTTPSNADVMWDYKGLTGAFDTTTIVNRYRGNSPAPKGHFPLALYHQDRTSQSGVSLPVVSTVNRCATVTFFQGRVFYAGLQWEGYNSKIFFSPIIQRPEQYGQCYQANDPTSDTVFDLLPDDGGVIQLQQAGTVVKMFPTPGGLVVFCTNGVWLVTGSTGLGFTAVDYSISKISSITTLTATSFVDAGGTPVWWNLDGIYTLTGGPSGGMVVQSLTVSSIQSFYDDIPPSSKRHAHGSYNPVTGIIQWTYRSTDGATINDLYEPDRILNFNSRTNAFYVWTSNHPAVKLHASFVLEQLGGSVSDDTVVDDAGDIIIDGAGNTVDAFTIVDGIVSPRVKYLVSYPDGAGNYKFTMAEVRDNVQWIDYVSYASGSASPVNAYIVGGYKVHGDGMRKFQPEYIQVFTKNDYPTAYVFQTQWNFANNQDTGKWSNPQQVTHNAPEYDYSTRRLKVRGHGLVLQFKVSQITGAPFNLVGWSSFETVNSQV